MDDRHITKRQLTFLRTTEMHATPKITLLFMFLACFGCRSAPTNSVKIQSFFFENVPPDRSVGLMPVLVNSLHGRREKTNHLNESILAQLIASKLFKQVAPTNLRTGGAFDMVLEVKLTDRRLEGPRTSTTGLNVLTLGLYSLLGGEHGRYQVRTSHTIRIWSGSRKTADFTVINNYSAPLTIYTDSADYASRFASLELTPQIALEKLAYSAKASVKKRP